MTRSERQYALVDLLRGARSPVSATRLAREFEVSTRTIERDIDSLQRAGVPIYADRGATGGYSILREYSLPPLGLTGVETLAVLAGLALVDGSPFASAARRARAKILAIVGDDTYTPLHDALSTMRVIDPAPVDGSARAALELLPEAIAARRVVHLDYESEDGVTRTSRDVEAMGLLRAGNSWLLVGWCRLREAIRGFALERIVGLEITGESFAARDPAVLEADLARWPHRILNR